MIKRGLLFKNGDVRFAEKQIRKYRTENIRREEKKQSTHKVEYKTVSGEWINSIKIVGRFLNELQSK